MLYKYRFVRYYINIARVNSVKRGETSVFGQKLKMLRERKKMSRKQLSEVTKINVSRISEYENDKRRPRIERLETFATALGVQVSYFFKK